MKPKIYIFSGLGVDHRVFQNLDFSASDPTFISWIVPLRNEVISEYARRLSKQITQKNAIYVGLSFGGIIAAEVAQHIRPQKIILIASAKTYHEIPPLYRVAGRLRIHRLIPVQFMLRSNFITEWFFGVKTSEQKVLLSEILKDTNPVFLKWAIHEILFWKNASQVTNTLHIHGASDRILPYRRVKADFCIPGGGHFMTIDKSAEIQVLLNKLIGQNSH